MTSSRSFGRYALSICGAIAMLAGCGGSQPPIGAPGTMPQSNAKAPLSYEVLFSFDGSDGTTPYASLVNVNGTLYGTTAGYFSNGTVFSLSTTGMEDVLYRFGGAPDGALPFAGLINVNGTLYGTTEFGGRYHRKKGGYGTVFSVSTTGTERVVHSFRGRPDGDRPFATLIDMGGTLYGTTRDGGTKHEGTVFSISTTGAEHVLYSFGGSSSDGSEPDASLIDVSGTLYGTTQLGGTYGAGTVFSIQYDRRGARAVQLRRQQLRWLGAPRELDRRERYALRHYI